MTDIDLTQSEQYSLSIRLSADGFSFSIHHPDNEGEHHFATFPVNTSYSMTANVKRMIQETEELKQTYGTTNILIDTSRYTLVPFALFEDEQTEAIFYHNFPRNDNEIVLCNILGKSDVALLFGMDKHTHQLLGEHFPHARFFACISPIMEHFCPRSRECNSRNVYAHFRESRMEVLAFDRGKLLLANTFDCKLLPDRIYYLLYVWQQLGLSQEKDRLFLIPKAKEQEALLSELKKYLKRAEIIPVEGPFPFDIQTLLTCE